MMHGAPEMQVLMARGRMTSLLPNRERSRRLLVHEDLKDGAAIIRAKAKLGLPVCQDR